MAEKPPCSWHRYHVQQAFWGGMICQWLVHAQCLVSEIEEPLLTRLARVMVIRSTVVQMSISDGYDWDRQPTAGVR